MKIKLITIAIMLLFSSSVLLKAQTIYEWNYVNTLQNETFRKICTQGLDTVYIVGENGLIAQSPDRAITWTKKYPVTAQLNDIIFCNHETGFAVGNNGTILKTADAGDTWIQVASGTLENLNAIDCVDIDNIWIVGDNGIVLYSHDNGNIWQIKDLPLTTKLNDISFKNSTGYIVGNNSVCYKTTDAGDNWNSNSLNNSGDNLVVQQTENKNLYVLYVDEDRYQWNIYFNGNIYPMDYETSSFYAINDSIGIGGAFYGIPTGGGSTAYARMRVCKYGNYMGDSYLPLPKWVYFDEHYCDIKIINDSLGYVVSGACLFRINNTGTGLNLLYMNDEIQLKQDNNYLKVTSKNSERIIELNITSISGMLLCTQKGNKINVSNLQSGTYIINVVFKNKNYTIKKWIKY